MSKTLGSLTVGAKIEVPVLSAYQSRFGSKIVFKIADKNHSGYPSNSVTLITEKIIQLFIFCKNTDGGRAFVFARFQTTVNSDPVAFAIQLRKNTLAAIECYAGHRQRKNAVRSFKFASAGFCFRLRAGFFLLLQARFGGGFTRLFLFRKSYKSKDNGNGNTGSEFADPVRKEGEGTYKEQRGGNKKSDRRFFHSHSPFKL